MTEISNALEKDEKKSRSVEASMYKRAKGYKVSVKKTYKVKRVEYDPDTGKKTLEKEELQTGIDEVHVPADVRAGAYWLNNRLPDRWREHPSQVPDKGDAEGEGGVVLLPDIGELDAPDDEDSATEK